MPAHEAAERNIHSSKTLERDARVRQGRTRQDQSPVDQKEGKSPVCPELHMPLAIVKSDGNAELRSNTKRRAAGQQPAEVQNDLKAG